MKKTSFSALALSLALGAAASAKAAVLITIDVANIASESVRFSATSGASSATDSSFTTGNGISLVDFINFGSGTVYRPAYFTNQAGSSVSTYSLGTFDLKSASVTASDFFNGYGVGLTTIGNSSLYELEIYNGFASGLTTAMSFVTGETAFTGSALVTGTFKSGSTPPPLFDYIPAVGTIGDIVTGFRTTIGPVIGQWQVIDSSAIPEPSTYSALVGLATLGFAALRRHRRAV
ncbi:MAG: PEP-CTERM sorting domain-containing protein [Verrucomicrobia bacterium]|nr:PEP-CTERM sorting domain-containing protein [Verrucomicrobiota bacterium]